MSADELPTASVDEAFGRVLRKLRMERGLSQEGLGHASGSGRTYVSELERGEKGPTLKTIFAFAGPLKIEAAEIVRLVDEDMHEQD